MTFRPDLLVPYAYSGRQEKPLGWVREWLLEHHHPEYVERIIAWFDHKDGLIGPGGGWRAGGAQPSKPGFAPEGKSFHQDQAFVDGFCGAAAVDLVKRTAVGVWVAPAWVDVPRQGGVDAAVWGVHCNIGTESWHMQPVEIDGWQSWWDAGRSAPMPGYPFPGRFPLEPEPEPTPTPIDPEEDDMQFIHRDPQGRWRIGDGIRQTMYAAADGEVVIWHIRRRARAGHPLLTVDDDTLAVTEVTELAHVKSASDRAIRALGAGGGV